MSELPTQTLPVTSRHDIYPGIDPTSHYSTKSYKGKVVFITGCSRGIGEAIAQAYARSGADLVLVARKQTTLDQVKETIFKELPDARVETFPADVTDSKEIAAAIAHTIQVFGKLDIAVANAGKGGIWDKPFTEKDPDDWWNTVEVNIRGPYNVAHYALPYLDKTEGYFIVTSSAAANFLVPFGSAYGLSKNALGRLIEYAKIEHSKVKSFSVHPGAIRSAMAEENLEINKPYLIDTLDLPAATYLRLTSGNLDWLSGRFVSCNWDLDEVERDWKQKIIEQNALLNQLTFPF